MNYKSFIKDKIIKSYKSGFDIDIKDINPKLFDFQKDLVKWSLKLGKAALFTMTGTGKTFMECEFAKHVYNKTKQNALIVAPLAVSKQTILEAKKINIKVNHIRNNSIKAGINIINYEQLDKINADDFGCIILDESSILKNYSGKMRNMIIDKFSKTPYKLCGTATPSPNDYMELGNHSEFLDIMKRKEMLAMFFVHDGETTSQWRLKGHASNEFWKWIASWAAILRKPSDLDYDDKGFILPDLITHEHVIKTDVSFGDSLFQEYAETLSERRQARKMTIEERVKHATDIVNNSNEIFLIWCNLNAESEMLRKKIKDSVEIKGSNKDSYKTEKMLDFAQGKIKCLITKPKIAGFGMNWQICHNMIFVGLSDSFEQYFQAVRRSYRFGQKKKVNVHIITSDIEGNVIQNIKRKERNANKMLVELVKHTRLLVKQNIKLENKIQSNYYASVKFQLPKFIKGENMKTKCINQYVKDNYSLYHGDSCEIIKGIPDESIGYSVFSPPFADLYTYSNNERDMGNSKNYSEFFNHFNFLIKEMLRITMPGRSLSFHCMNIPTQKERDGYIGIHNFRDDLIKSFQNAGWIFHSEVVIWKDPLIAAVRTHALGLMHKQLQKDSAICRQGLPDYLITMRKPGKNKEPIEHKEGLSHYAGSDKIKEIGVKRSHMIWRAYASPVWMDIRQSNTLQKASAREANDEKHICPLQFDVIERALVLWSNPHDIIFSPFMGIGSEIYKALLMDRKGIGIELKESYYNQAVENCKYAYEIEKNQIELAL